ncbi:MAG: hypothetical protein HY654_07680, partial [Acidobacteria bacterium]|nr:hypothetical protein [Acidobacteriota bacterium]
MSARRLASLVPAILVAAPIVLLVVFIIRFAVNVPAGDEWHLARDLHATYHGQEGVSDLWRLHNEHRLPFPRVALIGLAFATGWNAVAEMYASAALLVVMAGGWWRLHRDIGGQRLWTFVPLAWLVLSIGQWENILTGWQLQFCLGAAAMFSAIYLLGRASMSAFGGAVLCAIVASYSFNNGLVVWPAGLVTLWLRGESLGRLIRWAIG